MLLILAIGAPTSFEDFKTIFDALTGGDGLMFALAVVFMPAFLHILSRDTSRFLGISSEQLWVFT